MKVIKRLSGLTLVKLAERIDVPVSTLSTYCRYRDPDTETLKRIAREFNVSVDWLIGFEDESKNMLFEETRRLLNENRELKSKLKAIINVVDRNRIN